MPITELDMNAAANTPIKDIFAELRDSSAKLKVSAIIVGSLLPQIQKKKTYKEKGYKSYNDFITSLGLSIEMANNLVQIATTLAQKFPESYKKIRSGDDDSYLPSKKAMNIATTMEKPADDFAKPVGVSKLRKMAKSFDSEVVDKSLDVPIDKLAKSSKVFTKKVSECDVVPDGLKNEMLSVNAKIQELNP